MSDFPFGDCNGLEWFNGRAIENGAALVESRTVTGAVPGLFFFVPTHDAAEMRTDGGACVQDALFVTIDSVLGCALANYRALAARNFVASGAFARFEPIGVL